MRKRIPEQGEQETANGPRFTRRGLILGAAAGVGAQSALAQDAWWQNLPGFGPPAGASARLEKPKRREPPPLEDLRQGKTPWRSDEMLRQVSEAIRHYESIVQKGGWPMVAKGRTLRLGDDDERVVALRKRLLISGDLSPKHVPYSGSFNFDDYLEAALKRFQERHGLRTSGRLDIPTRAHINISAAKRLDQLRLNHRRIQALMQGRIEDRYVLVNAPAYQLEAVEGFEARRRHRVIVGKPNRQTPEIKATIVNLNFFPYWRVPLSVARLDLIPRLQHEPEYLEKEKITARQGSFDGPVIDTVNLDWSQVDPTRVLFRQEPGPQNALGLVRIDMPNSENVYMHDTPMKPLFKTRDRAFSAGCVRVQDVFDLVAWIAKFEPGFGEPGRIDDILAGGQAVNISLTRPIPVYFTYITAWAEEGGEAVFRPDIYNRDGAQELAGEDDPEAPAVNVPQMLAP
ncbi:MAG: hypothetical protein RLZ98_916 [Pseudomonadota bacterium]|jgi:murein L,D-transpeptidase YcbB/YkuD